MYKALHSLYTLDPRENGVCNDAYAFFFNCCSVIISWNKH